MNRNRFLSLLLVLTMFFMCIPVGMFAESEDTVFEEGVIDTANEAGEEPAAEEPAEGKTVTEEPTTEEPAEEKTVTEESVVEEPETEEPAEEKIVTEEPVAEEPETEEPVEGKNVTEELTAEEPVEDKSATEESITEDTPVEDSEDAKTATDESTNGASTEETVTESTSEVSVTEEPVTDGTEAEEAVVEDLVEEETLIFEIEDDVLKKYNGEEEEVTVPDGVKEIGKKAFEGNKSIKKIILPDSVETISSCAFADCSNLEKVIITDQSRLETIGWASFKNCKKIDISFAKGVKTVVGNAFEGVGKEAEEEKKEEESIFVDEEISLEAAFSEVVPGKVTQNASTAEGTTVTVSWEADANATSYIVYWGYSNDFSTATAVDVGNVTSYKLTDLREKTYVSTWVQAVNAAGEGEVSARKYVKTKDALVLPGKVTQNASTAKGNTVTVSWEADANATSYIVYWGYSNDFNTATAVDVGNVTSYTLTDLREKTYVSTWVQAVNAAGEGEVSARKYVKTGMLLPGKVTQNAPVVEGNTITVSWQEVATSTSYTVFYGTENDISKASPEEVGESLTYTISELEYSTEYYVWVTARNAAGYGEASDPETATTEAPSEIIINDVSYAVLTDSTIAVVGYIGTETDLTGENEIPTTVEYDGVTYTVTEIGEKAFLGKDIVSISLPNTITVIRSQAFKDCSHLSTMTNHD